MKPSNAGIYALKHRPTGKAYIGSSKSLRARKKKWFGELATGGQELPRSFPLTNFQDWDFTVVRHYEPEQYEKMRSDELAMIRAFKLKAPDRCLNYYAEEYQIEYKGQVVTMAELSRLSGISQQTLSYRYKQGLRGHALVATPAPKGPRPKK